MVSQLHMVQGYFEGHKLQPEVFSSWEDAAEYAERLAKVTDSVIICRRIVDNGEDSSAASASS